MSSPSQLDLTSLDLTPEFSEAFRLMEKTTDCLFITGSAGTGKSTLLTYFRENTVKNVVVLAPTGIAALNVGGQTIHSFFKFPIGVITGQAIKKAEKPELYKAIDTLIIDEISMVRADIIDGIDHFMRTNGRDKKLPFGGAQVIMIGDVFQLPPVVTSEEEQTLFGSYYETPYFFSAKVFDSLLLRKIRLNKIFRQRDPHFIEVLQAIRSNTATNETLQTINQRFFPEFIPDAEDFYVWLTSTNDLAAQINTSRLLQLRENESRFTAAIDGRFDKKFFPAEETLVLKKNAQVMFLKNDPSKRWVNGTIGKVKEVLSESVKVEIETDGIRKIVTAERVEWEILKYDFNSKTKQISSQSAGKFIQFPLRLAWAVTIHKSQGKTFDRVVIDMGRGAFAHGQLYVALSRCRTLNGIMLRSKVRPRDIIVDERIVRFVNEL
ncbi:MAG: AAA family ATPase [Chloroherpetonaceae bacterium]|nr:AAA family ATPase [Chloroherpetonaceae bacterium]